MHARRSSRRSNNSEQPVVDEPIYVQADALRPAQWARLELSPRTGSGWSGWSRRVDRWQPTR